MTTPGRCSRLQYSANDRLGIESSGEMEPVQHQSEGLACSDMEAEEAPLAGQLAAEDLELTLPVDSKGVCWRSRSAQQRSVFVSDLGLT